MTDFMCIICKKTFTRREAMDYHAKNKVCVGKKYKLEDNCNAKKTFACKFCNKKFTSATSMYRHVNHSCKIKKADTEAKENILDNLIKFKQETEKQIKQIKQLKVENVFLSKKIEDNAVLKKENNQLKEEVKTLRKSIKIPKNSIKINNIDNNINNNQTNSKSSPKKTTSCDNSDSQNDNQHDNQHDNIICDKKNTYKKKKKIPASIRREVWIKHIGITFGQSKCYCCKRTDIDILNFNCGHVVSEHDGGTLDIDNLRPICQCCNSSMGTQNMYDYINKYKLHK
jgi:hypothetical protein